MAVFVTRACNPGGCGLIISSLRCMSSSQVIYMRRDLQAKSGLQLEFMTIRSSYLLYVLLVQNVRSKRV
jgi:hypothetical protein